LTRTSELLSAIQQEFPNFRLYPKSSSRLCAVIDRILRGLTLGKQTRFMSEYHTVLGETLFLAPSWETMDDRARYVLLCHERVHLRQRRRYGSIIMTWLYLVPFVPMGLAYGRARIEWEAYAETLRATAEVYGIEAILRPGLKEHLVARFVGPDYGYMWPFPKQVARWYEEARTEIERDMTTRMTKPRDSANPHSAKTSREDR
jgi:hypothetical protein